MKNSTLLVIGGAVVLAVGAFYWHSQQAAAGGTPVNQIVPGGRYQMAVPVPAGIDPDAYSLALWQGTWTGVQANPTPTPGLVAAAKANGITNLVVGPYLIWTGTYNGLAAPVLAGSAAVRLS